MKKTDSKIEAFPGVVLLVCRDCRKRSNGPKDMKAKTLSQAMKPLVRLERPRPRVVLSSCLGLCPRRATAIARVGGGGGGESRITAIADMNQLEGIVPLLTATTITGPR